MLKTSMLLGALLALSSLGMAQKVGQQEATATNPPQGAESGTTCEFTFTSGNGGTFTQYCLTTNGTIVQFASPAGFEFIEAGGIIEGYGVCDFASDPPVRYTDYAQGGGANWGPTTVTTPNAKTKKFVRTTSDGIWQLTQTITQIKATASSVGSVKIVMALKNLSGTGRSILLLRYADVDASGTHLDDNFNATRNFAYGAEPGLAYGLGLTNNTFTVPNYAAFTRSLSGAPDVCNISNVNSSPFTGDGVIGMSYVVGIPAGASKTFTMTYKPI